MQKALWQACGLLAFSVACGSVAFFAHPTAPAWSVDEFEIPLEQLGDPGEYLWVDARSTEDFKRGTFPGAVSVNVEAWETGLVSLLDRWIPGQSIIVFCSSQKCLRSAEVAERLRSELGVEEIYALKGGWETLQASGWLEQEDGP